MTKRELLEQAAALGVEVPAGATKAVLEQAIQLVTEGGPLELTVARRGRLLELLRENPWRGHVAAARQVGLQGTRGELRRLLDTDDEFQEQLAEARREFLAAQGLGVPHLIEKLAAIVADDGNASQLRAIDRGFALNGVPTGDVQRVEHTGADGGPMEVSNPDVAAAIDRFTAQIRLLARRDEPGGDLRDADTGRAGIAARAAGE